MADNQSGAQRLHPPSGGSSILDVLNSVKGGIGGFFNQPTSQPADPRDLASIGSKTNDFFNRGDVLANIGLALGGAGVFGGGNELARILLGPGQGSQIDAPIGLDPGNPAAVLAALGLTGEPVQGPQEAQAGSPTKRAGAAAQHQQAVGPAPPDPRLPDPLTSREPDFSGVLKTLQGAAPTAPEQPGKLESLARIFGSAAQGAERAGRRRGRAGTVGEIIGGAGGAAGLEAADIQEQMRGRDAQFQQQKITHAIRIAGVEAKEEVLKLAHDAESIKAFNAAVQIKYQVTVENARAERAERNARGRFVINGQGGTLIHQDIETGELIVTPIALSHERAVALALNVLALKKAYKGEEQNIVTTFGGKQIGLVIYPNGQVDTAMAASLAVSDEVNLQRLAIYARENGFENQADKMDRQLEAGSEFGVDKPEDTTIDAFAASQSVMKTLFDIIVGGRPEEVPDEFRRMWEESNAQIEAQVDMDDVFKTLETIRGNKPESQRLRQTIEPVDRGIDNLGPQ